MTLVCISDSITNLLSQLNEFCLLQMLSPLNLSPTGTSNLIALTDSQICSYLPLFSFRFKPGIDLIKVLNRLTASE